MNRKYLCVIYFIFLSNTAFSQLLVPIVGTYNKKSAQSMIIYGDNAFLFNDGGECRQLNLSTGKCSNSFLLACSQYNPHVNNVCFGLERTGKSKLPVVYVSESRGDYRCFVESIEGEKRVIQTIKASENGKPRKILNWVVDAEGDALYAITRIHKNKGVNEVVKNVLTKYRLPMLKEGSYVMLTENDVIESISINFPNALQNGKINSSLLYQCVGLSQLSSYKNGSERAIIIIDLKKKEIVKKIDLTYVTTNEPEGLDFHNGKCLLFCGQNGGIYEVDID